MDGCFSTAGESWCRKKTPSERLRNQVRGERVVEPIHKRMPVILECEREEEWLFTEDADERKALLKPYPGQDLTAYPISTQVNDPAHDSPKILVEANDHGGQSGLGDFT